MTTFVLNCHIITSAHLERMIVITMRVTITVTIFVLNFQIITSVLLVRIIVITMRHVLIRMDHLPVPVTLDMLETE